MFYILQDGLQTESVQKTFHNIPLGELTVKAFLQVFDSHQLVVYKGDDSVLLRCVLSSLKIFQATGVKLRR